MTSNTLNIKFKGWDLTDTDLLFNVEIAFMGDMLSDLRYGLNLSAFYRQFPDADTPMPYMKQQISSIIQSCLNVVDWQITTQLIDNITNLQYGIPHLRRL